MNEMSESGIELRYSVRLVDESSFMNPNEIMFNELFESDGNILSFPTQLNDNLLEKVNYYSFDQIKATDWRRKIGTFLAETLNLTTRNSNQFWILSKFPTNYQFYSHHSAETRQSKIRTDFYLFGPPGKKFRSPYEVNPHLIHLLNPKIPCICKYCSNSKKQKVINSKLQMNSPKRSTSLSSDSPRPKRLKPTTNSSTTPKSIPILPPTLFQGVFADRQRDMDLTEGAIYRKGELIWLKLPNSIKISQNLLHSIQYWPGIIDERKLVTTSSNIAPNHSFPILKTTQSFAYSVQYLACADRVIIPEALIKPWLALESPLLDSNTFGTKNLLDGKQLNLPKMEELTRSPNAVFYFAFALEMSAHIATSYSLLDRYNITPEQILCKRDLVPYQTQELTRQAQSSHYQSLWLGPELLWSGELVRLLEELVLPPGLQARSAGAEDRSLFLRIDGIFQDKEKGVAIVSGRLYELEAIVGIEIASLPSLYMPAPPTGFRFRLLSTEKSSINVDLEYLAGRYYPPAKLVAPPTQTASKALIEYQKNGTQKNLELMADRLLTLQGLLPAYTLFIPATKWALTRAEAVLNAGTAAEESLNEFYKKQRLNGGSGRRLEITNAVV